MSKTHRNRAGATPSGAADADNFSHSLGEKPTSGERLHRAHRGANAGVELVDAEMVEEAKLSADHVKDGEDRETRCIGLSDRRVDGGWTSRSVAAP